MSNLPTVVTGGDMAVVEPATGELVSLNEATDRALAEAAKKVADLDKELFAAKRALAFEMRQRHGVGKSRAGGFRFTVAESTSWPFGATKDALERLLKAGKITSGDKARAMPSKPAPNATALKGLLSRLMVSDPDAARVLAAAATVSPPSLRDLEPDAIDHEDEDVFA